MSVGPVSSICAPLLKILSHAREKLNGPDWDHVHGKGWMSSVGM